MLDPGYSYYNKIEVDEIVSYSVETDEELVIRMLKGGFEKHMGMSYQKFATIHKQLLENHPEKLI